jgi:vacuolar-type H+-ATPase subunit D/Vma8
LTDPGVKDEDSILMNELRINDEKLSKEMYDAVLNPTNMLNILLKKLKLYNETEPALKEPRNKLIVGFMKIAVENRMLITQIKRDMDEQVEQIIKRIDQLEKREKHETEEGRQE